MSEKFTNAAETTLAASITAASLSLTVASGDGNDLFPVLAPASADFFRCLLFNKATGNTEIIKVTDRTGDIFTIARAQEDIGNIPAVAYPFNAGDIIELRMTKGFLVSLGAVTTNDIQSFAYNYAVDGGSINAYSITLSPGPAAYSSPGRYMFLAGATNDTASTLAISGAAGGPKNILRLDGSFVQKGDIVAGKVSDVIYDGSNFVLLNPRSRILPNEWLMGGLRIAIGGTATFDAVFDNGTITGTTRTIDWTSGNKQKIKLSPSTGNNVVLSFTPPNGPCSLIITITQDATGSRTVTWPALMRWPYSVEPLLTTGGNGVDVVAIYYDGASFTGSMLSEVG